MMTFNLREQQTRLQARMDELRAEIAFAQKGEKPWTYRSCLMREGRGYCEKHGKYHTHILVWSDRNGEDREKISCCPDCLIAEANDLTMELSSLKAEELTDNAGIALRFRDCEFDNYLEVNPDAARNLAACRRYAENWPDMLENGTSLVMTGSCGTGKNHLAVSMAKHIIRNHLASVEITDVMRLTRAVKNCWRNDSEKTADEVIEHYASMDLLIVDEVGVQFGSAAEMAILQEIINARYESILPTILISNLSPEELWAFISPRIADRITDGGRNWLSFNWPSYRSRIRGVAA
ncbi:ATP-binding protein [Escherichia coli]|uniref:ATP-binding protein n=1 Tax=Escherichia coli TaxID=562 RepID=A0A7H9S5N5_ECOLX|nr:ATP-binding protein [Escherichia coli]EFH4852865.1 AAA family ATPase [Escherichia coli]EFH6319328.1 AAA family ATPase [Escherichia coli]EFH6724739.1 AAA family ATPase [Escherichia coli]EFK5229984.1 ATP-binding protein [Escherichia coli]ELX1923225.1 ATP-binding protein [Escherichia coli]